MNKQRQTYITIELCGSEDVTSDVKNFIEILKDQGNNISSYTITQGEWTEEIFEEKKQNDN